jgi:hypothetical protein
MKSQDGLVKGNSPSGDEFVKVYDAVCVEHNEKERQCIAFLRHIGVKMAHPDDGWVNREKNILNPCYPSFNDNPKVGDLIYLGWPTDKRARLVQVINIESSFLSFGKRYFFKELTHPAQGE